MLSTGEQLSHYRIISTLGTGGMGEVYLADDTKLERQVALKVLLPEVAEDEERVLRFMQEARAASALNHPNILTVHEIGIFEDSRYIATEFVRGRTLRERLRAEPLTLSDALDIAMQVAAALCAAHEAGIVHRDVKPENIMIRDDGLVKVLDFGLAKLVEKQPETAQPEDATKALLNTQPGMIMGTAAYMSPEQARGHTLDARTDIFSLGIVMYELFTGRRPFEGESHVDLISSILKDEPPSLRQLSPGLPRHLERIVDKTLRKDRDNRYQHVKDLHIDLGDLLDELKFEAKLNKSGETMNTAVQATGATDLRSAFTTGISTTRRFTLLHAFGFGLVATILIGAAWVFRPGTNGGSAIAAGLKTTEVANWSSAAGELFSNASFSPDGRMIAFASTKSGTKNIWITQTASTDAIQVTNDAFANVDPIWSPKGDEIAYLSKRGADEKTNALGVWRVPALGGTPRSVGAVPDGSSELRRWTASGKLYYQSKGDLYAMDASSGVTDKVTSLDTSPATVAWVNISPDEKSLAYVTKGAGGWQIFASDTAGASSTKVAGGHGEIEKVLAWLPEKGRFYYSAAVNGVLQVFMVTSGGVPVQITSSETDSVVVDASPDGSSIIFSAAKEESNLWRVNIADGQEGAVARDLNSKLWASVAPNGERIVFQSVKNMSAGNNLMKSAIAVKPLKTGNESERPTVLAENGFLPTWSPDGSGLAFMRQNADGSIEISTVNASGGGERRLTAGGISVIGYSVSPYNHVQSRAFAWSPDSSRIAYVSERNGAPNVWTVQTRDGHDAPLTDNDDAGLRFYCPTWSSDGKRIAFFAERTDGNAKKFRGLRIVDHDTRTSANIFETTKIIRLIGWTADDGALIIAESEKVSGLPPETVLKRVNVKNGAESLIARLKNVYYYNIFLSADGKYAGYAARNQERDDIWVIPSTGGDARKLTNNNDSGLYFSRLAWLPDGSAIVFGKQTRFSLLSMITNIQ